MLSGAVFGPEGETAIYRQKPHPTAQQAHSPPLTYPLADCLAPPVPVIASFWHGRDPFQAQRHSGGWPADTTPIFRGSVKDKGDAQLRDLWEDKNGSKSR